MKFYYFFLVNADIIKFSLKASKSLIKNDWHSYED